jgi:uroporphyrinogen-III synthase
MSIAGRIIALAEGRQLEDLARLLEKEGAVALRCPMLSIIDQPDGEPVIAWLRQLDAGKFSHLILLTGEGLRRLIGFAERDGARKQFIAALGRLRIISRGPKPVQALKEVGLTPTKIAAAPTTEGVIATLKEEALAGAIVGVQLYSPSNQPLIDFLTSTGAAVATVLPYLYAPAADGECVAELIGKMDAGRVDAIVFTSAPQIDRLVEVAAERSLTDELKRGLTSVKIAAVGPVVAEKLKQIGFEPDVVPAQGYQMKNLVQHIKRAFDN